MAKTTLSIPGAEFGILLEALAEKQIEVNDLETVLNESLDLILKVTKWEGGIVYVRNQDDKTPILFVSKQFSKTQQILIENKQREIHEKFIANKEQRILLIPDGLGGEIAVINLETTKGSQGLLSIKTGIYSEETLEAILKIAQALGRMIYIGRRLTLTVHSIKEIDTITKIVAGFGSDLEIDEAEMRIVKAIREVFDCDAAFLALKNLDQPGMIIKKTLTRDENWIYQISLSAGAGIIGYSIKNSTPIIINEPIADERFHADIDATPGLEISSLLSTPLSNNDQTLGVVGLENMQNGGFTLQDQQMLTSIAKSVVNTLYNLQLIHRLKLVNAELEASHWELLGSRNTLRTLFDNFPDSFYIVDRKYRLIVVNLARSKRAEKEPRLLVGNYCYEALYQRKEICPGCRIDETLFDQKITHRIERDWGNSEDNWEWDISTYPIVNENDQVIQVIMFEQDVTEKRRLEANLVQSEKLAALGQLAAGVAHEINNPLTVILANSQLLQREMPKDNQDWQESVDLISRAGNRALGVVRNLLNFARKEQYELVPTDINQTIHKAIEMIRHEAASRSVVMIDELADDLPLIKVSADNLQGVWLNILINALDATEEKQGSIRITSYMKNNEINVSISDDGQGIPPEKVKRIFEPFYTTKNPGRGTGLGLSVCHRVIKQHGGHISVDSRFGYGTTFTVTLPVIP